MITVVRSYSASTKAILKYLNELYLLFKCHEKLKHSLTFVDVVLVPYVTCKTNMSCYLKEYNFNWECKIHVIDGVRHVQLQNAITLLIDDGCSKVGRPAARTMNQASKHQAFSVSIIDHLKVI